MHALPPNEQSLPATDRHRPASEIDPPSAFAIYDTHPELPDHALANPEGSAQWFDEKVRPQVVMDMRTVHASTIPVPQQRPAELKTTRLLTAQLLKRFRDIRCDAREYDRMPSVLLSKIAVEAPKDRGLLADLRAAASSIGADRRPTNPRAKSGLPRGFAVRTLAEEG